MNFIPLLSHAVEFHGNRIGASSAVYLAAVLEYIVAEVMELSGNASKGRKFGLDYDSA